MKHFSNAYPEVRSCDTVLLVHPDLSENSSEVVNLDLCPCYGGIRDHTVYTYKYVDFAC